MNRHGAKLQAIRMLNFPELRNLRWIRLIRSILVQQ